MAEKKNRDKRNIVRIVVTVLLLIVCLVCVAILAQNWWEGYKADQQNEQLKDEVVKEEPEQEEPQEDLAYNPIDFATLQSENSDIYAWIQIPDTQIDYPVLQNQDTTDYYDEYYLKRLPDRTSSVYGSIFSQRINALDFSDRNTVLYGHNMKNGSMFAGLHKYEDREYMNSHEWIYIYTPEYVYTYQVFGAVAFSAEHVMSKYGFTSDEDTQAYLDDLRSCTGIIREDVKVTKEDHLLTLSTCIAQQANKRYLVVAKLQNVQKCAL